MGFDPNSAPWRITNRSEFLEAGEWLRNAVKADSGANSEDISRVRGMITAYTNFIEANSKICSRLSDPYATLIDLIVMNGQEGQYMQSILKLRDHSLPMWDVQLTYLRFGFSLREGYELIEKKYEPAAVGPDPATVPVEGERQTPIVLDLSHPETPTGI